MPIYKRNCEIKPGISMPEDMYRIAIAVEYNGKDFHGLQLQSSGIRTIQAELEKALSSIADETISIACAGRTDAGVHATQQVVHFDTLSQRPLKAWIQGANARLPRSICIRWAKPVSEYFHARFTALSRTYRYHIYNSAVRPALVNDQVTWFKRQLNIQSMVEAGSYLMGEKDFSSFRSSQCQANSPVRNVEYLRWVQQQSLILLEIKANAFLHHMVRNIMGTLLAVGAGDKPVSWVKAVLDAKDRTKASATAPAAGLYMVDVDYPAEFDLPEAEVGPLFLSHEMDWINS